MSGCLPHPDKEGLHYTFEIFVALEPSDADPKAEKPELDRHEATRLQGLMMSMLPEGLVPTSVSPFEIRNNGFQFGKVVFDGVFGQMVYKPELTAGEEELIQCASRLAPEPLKGRIVVRFYPDHHYVAWGEEVGIHHVDFTTFAKDLPQPGSS